MCSCTYKCCTDYIVLHTYWYLFNAGADAVVYLSPSIEYCAHPCYTSVHTPGKSGAYYLQIVLQVRVNPNLYYKKMAGSLPGATSVDYSRADLNFSNDELEWFVPADSNAYVTPLDGIVPYGLMLRISKVHPKNLPQNHWCKDTWDAYEHPRI